MKPTAPPAAKAFLVGVDREACALYKEDIDKLLPPKFSEVVISTQGKKDSERLRRYALTEEREQAIRKSFRKPDENPKILIVTEKLLTGFDAPILYCMYLDKPMRENVLLQAVARVNRPYEDGEQRRKPCGFVLDFVGIFDNLEKALAFDSKDVEGVIEGLDVLKDRFAETMDRARRDYLPIAAGKQGDKAVEAILEHFRDKERREEFYIFFREIETCTRSFRPMPHAPVSPRLRRARRDVSNRAQQLRPRRERGQNSPSQDGHAGPTERENIRHSSAAGFKSSMNGCWNPSPPRMRPTR